MYSILKTLSEYTYFYISENITSYTFVACFWNRRKPSVYPEINLQLKAVGLFKYVWLFIGHQALKG